MSEENEPNLVTIELKYVSKSNLSILLTLQLHGLLPLMNMGLLLVTSHLLTLTTLSLIKSTSWYFL